MNRDKYQYQELKKEVLRLEEATLFYLNEKEKDREEKEIIKIEREIGREYK